MEEIWDKPAQPIDSAQKSAAGGQQAQVAPKKKIPLWVLYTPVVIVNITLVVLLVVFFVRLATVLSR